MTDINDTGKLTIDRMKDDPCHGCRFNVLKPGDKTLAPWVRPYGCTCLDRIATFVDAASNNLRYVKSDMSSVDWWPNKPTIDTMNCVARLATEAADLLWDMLKYGYMEPETVCVFRRTAKEAE